MEQLGLYTELLKLHAQEPVLHDKRSHRNEKSARCNWSRPRLPQLEKACAQQGRPSTAKEAPESRPITRATMLKKLQISREHFMQGWAQLKGRNGKDLTEAEQIKKRWQEYTEE